jgi:O-methyltransferase
MDVPTRTSAVDLYLELLAKTLTRSLYEDNDEILGYQNYIGEPHWKQRLGGVIASAFRPAGIELVKKRPYDPQARELGRDWPVRAETMVGLRRLMNARHCIESVLNDRVPGDIIEAGVCRGGTAIYMRGVLKAYGVTDRTVWCADSFQGLPPPSPERYPPDANLHLEGYNFLAVDVDTVRRNFARYELLDDQVQFLIGWFKDTLPEAPIGQLAVLRLDGDLYESTVQALDALYPRLSVGGYCIIDDYGVIDACQQAVHDYRRSREITDEIMDVDGSGVYWQRTS